MAGIKFVTTAPAETAMKAAYRCARDLGYSVQETGDLSLRALQGNLALSIFLGAFILYCDFRIDVQEYDDENEVILEWSTPWWTGFIGIGRTKKAAWALMNEIGETLEDKKFKVSDNKAM